MKYFATYCVMDRNTGANPLYHSCILLSKTNTTIGKLEVVNTWGFYGVPSTDTSESLTRSLKLKMGLDIDLSGNHGMLRHEDIRYLDLGFGLHGSTFELTLEQFELLQDRCQAMEQEQNEAILEFVNSFQLKEKLDGKTRIYPYEHLSLLIYQLELVKAQQENREPRLKPFDFQLTFDSYLPSMEHAHTCKTQALTLLGSVLTEKQINKLIDYTRLRSIPRYSGEMERIYLHSTGPLQEHIKSTGEKVMYRDSKKNPEVKLYWTVPPQKIELRSPELLKQFSIGFKYESEVKLAVKQLQRLEWLFRNAEFPDEYQSVQTELIQKICESYEQFSSINIKNDVKTNDWRGTVLRFFSLPENQYERQIQNAIQEIEMFCNLLYMSAIESGEYDEEHPCPEALAGYLPETLKKQLCGIIGRNYVPDEEAVCNTGSTSLGMSSSLAIG